MNELINQARQILKDKRGGEAVNRLVPGGTISWEGGDGKIRGPAVIEGVFQADGHDWVWLTYHGQEILLNSRTIINPCDSSKL
jgi:hypothetical protein